MQMHNHDQNVVSAVLEGSDTAGTFFCFRKVIWGVEFLRSICYNSEDDVVAADNDKGIVS